MRELRLRTVLAAALAVAPAALAADPFVLTADTTSGPPATVTASGSNLADLVQDLVETRDAFGAFDGQAFRAALDYGGVRNAIRFEQNAAGTSSTLSIPSTGFSRTFTGANEAEVRRKIEDFLLKDGAQAYARFLREVNERSTIGVTDGNPLAATALLANYSSFEFGALRRVRFLPSRRVGPRRPWECQMPPRHVPRRRR